MILVYLFVIIMIDYSETNFAPVWEFLEPLGYLLHSFGWKTNGFQPFSGQRINDVFFITDQKAKAIPFRRSRRIS